MSRRPTKEALELSRAFNEYGKQLRENYDTRITELETRAEKAEADAARLRAALEKIRDERGVAPYDVARKALRPDEQPAESEGE